MAQALVPLKDLVQAKTRLAGLMTSSERRALAQAMIEDVLSVLCQHQGLERVTLVSDDPGAQMLASTYGAHFIREASLGCRGLNQVVAAASAQLLAGAPQTLLVLHGDLPLLGAGDITAAISAQEACGGLVIGCDRHRKGSNLLAFDRGSRPRFCFGEDSCAAHRSSAAAAGQACRVLFRRGIALDVDEAMDLVELMGALPEAGPCCTALLGDTGLGARLRLALSAMGGRGEEAKQHYE